MNLRKSIFHDHPTPIFNVLTIILTALASCSTASIIPNALALANLLVYSRIMFRSLHAYRLTAYLWASLTIGMSLPRLSASLEALSSVGVSLISLLLLSGISAFLTLGVLFVDAKMCSRLQSQWSQITLFPALWATLWTTVSYLSPLGHLSSWSPAESVPAYDWIIHLLGPASRDWVIAAWAVVGFQAIGIWYIGNQADEEPLIPNVSSNEEQPIPIQVSPAGSTLGLATFLMLLTLPSFLSTALPLPVASSDTTPFSVGCVLPSSSFKEHGYYLTLQDYITETVRLQSSANILLWPEGAVTFNSEQERDEGLDLVRKTITGSYVGVSFEETFEDPSDPTGWTGGKRAGLAVVSKDSATPHLVYHKRHLVPFTESFSLSHSDAPPAVYTIPLPKPKGFKRPWAPNTGDNKRPIPITASICLDFAHPSIFRDLNSRPALILAPARTWERSIGYTMWKQAIQRAEELDSMLLWCDGGEGGVSGIAGRGYNEVTRVGSGSWVASIGLQYPYDEHRTFYAWFGDASLLIFWGLVLVGAGVMPIGQLRSLCGKGFEYLWAWKARAKNRNRQGPVPNLLDI